VTQLVWFKRDLRVRDHVPLRRASRLGPVLCLYAYEDGVGRAPVPRAVRQRVAARPGGELAARRGTMPAILDVSHREHGFGAIRAHEETGNAEAKRRISAIRRTDAAKAEAERIYARHGSRKRPGRRSSRTTAG